MTAERVTAQQKNIHHHDQRADADAEMFRAKRVRENHRLDRVVTEQQNKPDGDVEKISVDVLNDERERFFAEIFFARLADGAVDRVGPERLVICAAIIIAGETKTARRP